MSNSLPLSDDDPLEAETSKSSMIPHTSGISALAIELRPSFERARAVSANATAENTRGAYAADWRGFAAWCASKSFPPLEAPPEIVLAYLADLSKELRPSSVKRAYCGISAALRDADANGWAAGPRPIIIKKFLAGLSRDASSTPRRKRPLMAADLVAALAQADLGPPLWAVRNRALLLFGFHGAFRRSELVALDVDDVELLEEGVRVRLPRSKTNQDGPPEYKGLGRDADVEICPAEALRRWQAEAAVAGTPLNAGPLFRRLHASGRVLPERLSDRAVARLIKRVAATLGLNADDFSGHSLRAGFATSAAAAGVPEERIMRQTGHKRVEQLREYIRYASVFVNNAGEGLLAGAKKKAQR